MNIMKIVFKALFILFIYILPLNAACDFKVNIGDSIKEFEKHFNLPFQMLPGTFMLPIMSTELCPNDNLNENIAIEFILLGEDLDKSNVAAINMITLNDGFNTEANKLTLMNYAKKVYGSFDTGNNPQLYNNFHVYEAEPKVIIYKRMKTEEEMIEEVIYISNKKWDTKLGEYYNELEEEEEKIEN